MRKRNYIPKFYCPIYLDFSKRIYIYIYNQYSINWIGRMLALGSKYFLPLETISYFKTIRKNSSLVYERRAERRRGIMEFFFFFNKYTYMEILHRTFFPRIKRVRTEGSTLDGTIEIPLTRIPLPSYDSLSLLARGRRGHRGRPTSLRRPYHCYLWLLPMAKAIDC